MKHILLPTDFSETAFKAAVYALDLFGTEDVQYTLVHTYLKTSFSHVLLPRMVDTEAMANNGLRRVERRLRKHAGKIRLAKVASSGQLYDVLNELAVRKGADLVVMGTQGEGNYGMVGRNTTSAVTDCELPMIAVPSEFEREPVSRIMLAHDGGPLDEYTLAPLRLVAMATGAFIEVLQVWEGEQADHRGLNRSTVSELLAGIPHSLEVISGANVVSTTNEQARIKRIQLVAVVRRHKSLLDRIFQGSTSKRMALHTTEPLLVLRENSGTGPRA